MLIIPTPVHYSPPLSSQTQAGTRCTGCAVRCEHNISFTTESISDQTYGILSEFGSILSHLVVDDPLGNTIRGSRLGHELRMANVIQHGVENSRLVNSASDCKKTG